LVGGELVHWANLHWAKRHGIDQSYSFLPYVKQPQSVKENIMNICKIDFEVLLKKNKLKILRTINFGCYIKGSFLNRIV